MRLERNDSRMVRWISAKERRTRLKLNSTRKCLQVRRVQWFGYLERIEDRISIVE